ncbi:MAG: alpha/beta fold hydrolase [Burkholderiaceae bacterium]
MADERRWVLLHGFTGGPDAWRDVLVALPGRALCPALGGHAPGVPAARDFVGEVDRLAEVVAAAGLAGAHLAGYSLGARVALGLLVRHPRLFGAATLIGGHPGLDEDDPQRRERADADERWARLAERSLPEFLERWRAQPIFDSQRALSAARRDSQDRLRAEHDGAALAAAMRALSLATMPDWKPSLASIGVPVHLVAGELDAKFVALAARVSAGLRNARTTIVPGVGHNVLLEHPRAVIAALAG